MEGQNVSHTALKASISPLENVLAPFFTIFVFNFLSQLRERERERDTGEERRSMAPICRVHALIWREKLIGDYEAKIDLHACS